LQFLFSSADWVQHGGGCGFAVVDSSKDLEGLFVY
jgi:hypothetical protein